MLQRIPLRKLLLQPLFLEEWAGRCAGDGPAKIMWMGEGHSPKENWMGVASTTSRGDPAGQTQTAGAPAGAHIN